jgi:hypothetical protein
MGKAIIEITENPVTVGIIDNKVVVELGVSGPQGPQLPLGHVHYQASASTTWIINHNLSFIPNITIVDSSGNVIEGSYNYPNSDVVIANFSNSFAGEAYLS